MLQSEETAVLVVSDIHKAKITKSYNSDILEKRLDKLATNLTTIHTLLCNEHKFDKLIICGLGDSVDGASIYPTQTHHQDQTDVELQCYNLAQSWTKFVNRLKTDWTTVDNEWVLGNHGRSSRYNHENSNWDKVFLRYLKGMLPSDSINFNDGSDISYDPFLRKITIRKFNYLLYHGSDILSYNGIPFYGIIRRISNWSTTSIAPFSVALFGHFHTSAMIQHNNITVLCNGTMVSDDDWALKTFGYQSSPSWWLFGVSNKRPITFSYNMELM